MTYVVTESCIRCKFTDCVDVCPVEAFHVGENMLVIDPEACIDCGVCEPECPADAIYPDSMADEKWLAMNIEFSDKWPLITQKISAPVDAEDFTQVSNKFEKYFSDAPGEAE